METYKERIKIYLTRDLAQIRFEETIQKADIFNFW